MSVSVGNELSDCVKTTLDTRKGDHFSAVVHSILKKHSGKHGRRLTKRTKYWKGHSFAHDINLLTTNEFNLQEQLNVLSEK